MSCNGCGNEQATYTWPLRQSESIGKLMEGIWDFAMQLSQWNVIMRGRILIPIRVSYSYLVTPLPGPFWLSETFRLDIVNACSKQGMGRSDLNKDFPFRWDAVISALREFWTRPLSRLPTSCHFTLCHEGLKWPLIGSSRWLWERTHTFPPFPFSATQTLIISSLCT